MYDIKCICCQQHISSQTKAPCGASGFGLSKTVGGQKENMGSLPSKSKVSCRLSMKSMRLSEISMKVYHGIATTPETQTAPQPSLVVSSLTAVSMTRCRTPWNACFSGISRALLKSSRRMVSPPESYFSGIPAKLDGVCRWSIPSPLLFCPPLSPVDMTPILLGIARRKRPLVLPASGLKSVNVLAI